MKRITVTPHQTVVGYWLMRRGRKTVGSICLPNYLAVLGLPPTLDNVRSAALELGIPINEAMDIRIMPSGDR